MFPVENIKGLVRRFYERAWAVTRCCAVKDTF